MKRCVMWTAGILVLVAAQLAGCSSTVQNLKQRGIEFDSGEVKRVYEKGYGVRVGRFEIS